MIGRRGNLSDDMILDLIARPSSTSHAVSVVFSNRRTHNDGFHDNDHDNHDDHPGTDASRSG